MSAGGMRRAGGCLARLRHLPSLPSRSTMTVSWPRRTKAACRLEPMKPAPPVTRIISGVIGGRAIPSRVGNMSERPRFFDDLAGVAGGAISALAGLREEIEALARARIDEANRRLERVRREDFDAMAELAANARAGQQAAEAQIKDPVQRIGDQEV